MSREDELARLAEQAGAAYTSGRRFFVARLRLGVQWRGGAVSEVGDFGEALEVVERAGWVLDRWTVSGDGSGGQIAFPVFRRGDGIATALQDRVTRH